MEWMTIEDYRKCSREFEEERKKRQDRYQFLDQIPENQMKELVEIEISRMKKEQRQKSAGTKSGAGDSPRNENHAVTFSDDEVFRMLDEERGESGGEDNLNDTMESQCTVRERDNDSENEAQDVLVSETRANGGITASQGIVPKEKNPMENVATVIESSIYCAKVKEMRIKIISELKNMIVSLENLNIALFDFGQLRQMCRRAAEYSARFQRIHLYQLQRQVNDINRHNSQSLPYAKHTQFQSQMVRVVALHQSTLQSLQLFHQSFEQTSCLRECAVVLFAICATLRKSKTACQEITVPNDFIAAKELYNDEVLASTEDLEKAAKQYVQRVDEYIAAADQNYNRGFKNNVIKNKSKKRNWSRTALRNTSEAETRLSMYSMDTLRLSQKGTKSETKCLKRPQDPSSKRAKETPKSHHKTPRSRRPLMRDPAAGASRRAAREHPEQEILTMVSMVEAVDAASTYENSPRNPRRRRLYKQGGANLSPHSPVAPLMVPPIVLKTCIPKNYAPKNASKRVNPYKKSIPSTQLQSETLDTFTTSAQTNKADRGQKYYRDIEDSEVQTLISDCQYSDRSQVSGDFYRTQPEFKSSKSGLDSSRSESSKCQPDTCYWRKPLSARSNPVKEHESSEVTRLLKQLCAGDSMGNRTERQAVAKNAQLVCVNASSPRQSTTPQLLQILEETIQKKIPSHLYKHSHKETDKMRLAFNIPQRTADNLFQYRTKFVQHMLTSSMYANSAVGKPWMMVGSISESIIDEVLLKCAEEMQIRPKILELYKSETC